MCYWPPNKSSTRCMKEELPDIAKWKKYEITILKSTGNTLSKIVVD